MFLELQNNNFTRYLSRGTEFCSICKDHYMLLLFGDLHISCYLNENFQFHTALVCFKILTITWKWWFPLLSCENILWFYRILMKIHILDHCNNYWITEQRGAKSTAWIWQNFIFSKFHFFKLWKPAGQILTYFDEKNTVFFQIHAEG